MRILIVSSYLPYPLFSGGNVRLFNLIKQLSFKHKITLICEKREYQTDSDINEIKKFCEEIITINRKKQWTLENILKTGFSLYPFLLTGHASLEMKEKIINVLANKSFDLIHVETFYVMQNLPKTYIPIVLVEHNVEYLVYKRFADTASFFIRPFLYIDVLKMKYWEEYFWKKANKLIAVSEIEKKIINKKDVVVIPNGVDLDFFPFVSADKKDNLKEKRILFMGDFSWIQNRKSAEWILKEIWPTIQLKINLKLWIVGKKIPKYIKDLDSNNVIFDENAPSETKNIYNKANILLSPIMVGGGTSYKILEAMTSGVPVVTTMLGMEGLKVTKDKEILVGETSDQLVNLVITLMNDKKLYENTTRDARKCIEDNYQWKIIGEKLEKTYMNLLNNL